ncbi:MAG: HAD family hydrolase [Candidatus Jettenia caeni]|nr:MAG: HAD family hydrolase [Candidatus Jettenia caeni]
MSDYAYIAVGLSLITFVCWYFLFYHLAGERPFLWALKMAIAVLVIACPCSLCWATPAATMVASRIGLKHSIVVKHSAAFEKIARLNVLVFDVNGLRQDVQDVLLHLKRMNIRVVMMTEDREQTTRFAVSGIGVDEYYNRISPDEKRAVIERFQRQGMKVGVVSNSGSDISSLTQPDVRIMLGAEMDVTKGHGDIILIKNDLMDVVKTVQLGRRTVIENKTECLLGLFV